LKVFDGNRLGEHSLTQYLMDPVSKSCSCSALHIAIDALYPREGPSRVSARPQALIEQVPDWTAD
jgi:hypothetical protein